jgi:hypothetical protein
MSQHDPLVPLRAGGELTGSIASASRSVAARLEAGHLEAQSIELRDQRPTSVSDSSTKGGRRGGSSRDFRNRARRLLPSEPAIRYCADAWARPLFERFIRPPTRSASSRRRFMGRSSRSNVPNEVGLEAGEPRECSLRANRSRPAIATPERVRRRGEAPSPAGGRRKGRPYGLQQAYGDNRLGALSLDLGRAGEGRGEGLPSERLTTSSSKRAELWWSRIRR